MEDLPRQPSDGAGEPQVPLRVRAELLRYRNLLFDRLTDLPTLPLALEQLRKLLDEVGDSIGVICVDLSRTRGLENSFGWQSTDQLIENLARVLKVFNREVLADRGRLYEEAIRTGSFFIFHALPGLTTERLREIAELIEEFINLSTVGRELSDAALEVKIGYSLIVADPLIRFERLVYQSVREAKEMAVDAEKREELLQDRELAQIIAGERIKTRFQPIMYISDLSVLGYEALSVGPPDTVFENAERLFSFAAHTGFSQSLDRICLRHAVSVAGVQIENGELLFLNTTPHNFADPSFRADFESDLGLSKDRIVLELTERSTIGDLRSFRRYLEVFKSEGFKIAIDDAGAGYSSLNTIIELQPDFLKFDRAMVTRIQENRIKQELLTTLLELADRTGSRVIAEGIETAEELEALREMGVELGQGYHLSKPTQPY
ncbi:MAG: EAL domain-containing protein [Candidatus Coatesbacteria bacterium]|nr:EAL domain-containing protein [Candidatus Coatesbacteria bacterium]